jgi:hypothetical protein
MQALEVVLIHECGSEFESAEITHNCREAGTRLLSSGHLSQMDYLKFSKLQVVHLTGQKVRKGKDL